MPELPEVEITRRKLTPLIRGRRVLDFWTDWPRGLKIEKRKEKKENSLRWVSRDMRGRRILDVTRRGKVLFFKLSPRRGSGQAGKPERMMAIHLRMSGRLEVIGQNDEVVENDKVVRLHRAQRFTERSDLSSSSYRWTHFAWRLSRVPATVVRIKRSPQYYNSTKTRRGSAVELRFVDPRKFGRVWYGSPADVMANPSLASLGVDANELLPADFVGALAGRRGMVKPLLLRQDIVAGIGNILADESLWRARIHPRTSVADLGDGTLRRLGGALGRTIRAVLASGGTSMRNFRHPDGGMGRYQEKRFVYGKAGEPCPRCRTRLLRIVVGSRGTTLCPKCQKIPNRK